MSPGVFVDIIVVLSYHIIYCFIYTKEFIDFYENYMFLHCESKVFCSACTGIYSHAFFWRLTQCACACTRGHVFHRQALGSRQVLSSMQRGTVLGEGTHLLETLLYVFKTMGCKEV